MASSLPTPVQATSRPAQQQQRSNIGSNGSSNGTNQRRQQRKFFFIFARNSRFHIQCTTVLDFLLLGCTVFVEKIVYILGPMLICFALAIMSGLGHTFFTIVLPMLQRYYEVKYPHAQLANQLDSSAISATPGSFFSFFNVGDIIVSMHIAFVCYVLSAIAFNYFYCVTTRNVGKHYDKVVREMAQAQGVYFPETEEERIEFQEDTEHKLRIRWQRRNEQSNKRLHLQQARTNAVMQRNTKLAKQINTTLQSTLPITQGDVTAAGDIETASRPTASMSSTRRTSSAAATDIAATTSSTASINAPTPQSNNTTLQHRRQQPAVASPNIRRSPPPGPVRNWMILAPDEWSWCSRSNQPKPPRSHYDHVSKGLILNLDHYCPWMFNAIGYFNYRYFCTFLWLVELGMAYGMMVSYTPFMNSTGPAYRSQVELFRETGTWMHMNVLQMVPIAREKMAISLTFMICLAVGIAVALLGIFHIYLVLTAQTTIEFHGNFMSARRARKEGKKWRNPYSLGMKRNWQQVFGSGGKNNELWTRWKNPILAVLIPSRRLPEYFPLPIAGEQGKCPAFRNNSDSATASNKHNEADLIV